MSPGIVLDDHARDRREDLAGLIGTKGFGRLDVNGL
jgi:hypothetical protein